MESPEDHASQEKRIALWLGRDREKGENFPFFTGRTTIEGKTYFITLWKRRRNTDRQPILSGELVESTDDQLDNEINER